MKSKQKSKAAKIRKLWADLKELKSKREKLERHVEKIQTVFNGRSGRG